MLYLHQPIDDTGSQDDSGNITQNQKDALNLALHFLWDVALTESNTWGLHWWRSYACEQPKGLSPALIDDGLPWVAHSLGCDQMISEHFRFDQWRIVGEYVHHFSSIFIIILYQFPLSVGVWGGVGFKEHSAGLRRGHRTSFACLGFYAKMSSPTIQKVAVWVANVNLAYPRASRFLSLQYLVAQPHGNL